METKQLKISHPALRPRRVVVSGGTHITKDNAKFCEALGRELAAESGLTIVTGGFKHLKGEASRPSADWSCVKGALEYLRENGLDPLAHIETMLPEDDSDTIVRIEEGQLRSLRNRTAQSRRFTMVNTADAVVTIQGEGGTAGVIDLALAIEKPVLPLPFTGGKSDSRWKKYKKLIQDWFGIKDADARFLEEVRIGGMTTDELSRLAAIVKQTLLARLMKKCFAIMPFDKSYDYLYENVLQQTASASDFALVRTDRLSLVGNAVTLLRDAINACDCALAIVTGFNPNVMYELGFAHAQGKQVIILCRYADGGVLPKLPFDIQTEQIIPYGDDEDGLKQALAGALREI